MYAFFLKFYFISTLVFFTALRAQTPDKIKKSEDEIRQEMIVISRQLGITCSECHFLKNFRDDSKKSFQVSIKHLKLVELLKANGMSGSNGEPEASCFTCHKGKLRFSYKESLNDHSRHDLFKKKNPIEKVEILKDTDSQSP